MARLELRSTLDLDASRFYRVMRASEQQAQRFGASVKSYIASAFTAGSIINFANHVTRTADRWEDLSDQLGISIRDIQLLEAAFIKAGLGTDGMASAVLKVSKAVDDLDKRELFERLGIGAGEMMDISGDLATVIRRVSQELEGMDRQTARQFGRELFGDRGSGERVLAALAAFRSQGPITITEEADVRRVAQLRKDIEEIKRVATGQTMGALGETLTEFKENPIKTALRGGFLGNLIRRMIPDGPSALLGGQFAPFAAGAAGQAGAVTSDTVKPSERMFSPFNMEAWKRVQDLLGEEDRLSKELETLRTQRAGSPRDLGGLNELQRIGGFGGEFGAGIRDTARNTQQIAQKTDTVITELREVKSRLATAQSAFE